MMELNEIKQYTHKIKTIHITNENIYSTYSYIVVKINIASNDDEVIRFSLEPNDKFIEHQHYFYQIDNDEEEEEEENDTSNLILNPSFENGKEKWTVMSNDYWELSDNGFDGKCIVYPHTIYNYLIPHATIEQIINFTEIKEISFYVKSKKNTKIKLYCDNNELNEKNDDATLDSEMWRLLTYDVEDIQGEHILKFDSLPEFGDIYLDSFDYILINNTISESLAESNDYYCYIPNNLNSITTLYAHFFPADLYDYDTELTNLISVFDFKELNEKATINSNRYEHKITDDGKLTVQSTDEKSVTGYHDPNYKNYVETNNSNKTEQGKFPLSSRYRNKKNWEVPNLSDANPKWAEKDDDLYWEARIPFDNIEAPVNVFINYEYLPTSREYHQHYFGFEAETSTPNTINVFEGTNINTLDENFGSKNNYRLINLGNSYDDKKSIYVPHENNIPIDLENFNPKPANINKQWKKNKCQNYYVYTPLQNGHCEYNISLNAGKYYSLKYYIYIPSYAQVDSETCYISVKTSDAEYKMHNNFIYKDKELRNQWIYHEIPFLATTNNLIKIVGPQSSGNLETDNRNSIYFTNISLQEMVEYSPTLQYTSTGLRLSEQNKLTFKSIAEESITQNHTFNDKIWTNTNETLPTPYTNINISTKNEKYVYYDPYTTNIYYSHSDEDENPLISFDNTTNNIYSNGITYVDSSDSDNDPDTLLANYSENLTGVYGPDNSFTFYITDDNRQYVTIGELNAGIFLEKNENLSHNDAEIKMNYYPVKVNGVVKFTNIDLSDLTRTDNHKYYIRLEYNTPCEDVNKVVFKPLFVYEEKVEFDKIKINGVLHNVKDTYVINDVNQVPLKIEAHLVNQNHEKQSTGYCELSIDDKLNQTTLMDTYNNDSWVDFYLSVDDLIKGTQTIKLEYYRQYFKSLAFIYFNIKVEVDFGDRVPIEVRIYNESRGILLTGDNYQVPRVENVYGDLTKHDDCILMMMNAKTNHEKYRVEFYREENVNGRIKWVQHFKQNVLKPRDLSFSFLNTEYGNFTTRKFKIITGNMLDDNGNVIEDLWLDNEKIFTISY